MITSTDLYMDRVHSENGYNCLHFVREVWQDHHGEDIWDRLQGLSEPSASRRIRKAHRRAWARLEEPETGCLVLMRRPRGEPHVGFYLRGRVLHLHPGGVEYQPLDVACRSFPIVEFYK